MDLEKRQAALEAELKLVKAKKAKLAAKKKAEQQAAQRADLMRRYRIAGEFLLNGATDIGALVNAQNVRFDSWVTNESDREFLGFPRL